MEVVSYTHLRNNLASVLDKVYEDHNPVLITRQKGTPAILISLEDYNSFEETAYLMRSPENAKRINRSIEALEKGMGVVHELIEVK
jgi:antitoxin YefM